MTGRRPIDSQSRSPVDVFESLTLLSHVFHHTTPARKVQFLEVSLTSFLSHIPDPQSQSRESPRARREATHGRDPRTDQGGSREETGAPGREEGISAGRWRRGGRGKEGGVSEQRNG